MLLTIMPTTSPTTDIGKNDSGGVKVLASRHDRAAVWVLGRGKRGQSQSLRKGKMRAFVGRTPGLSSIGVVGFSLD